MSSYGWGPDLTRLVSFYLSFSLSLSCALSLSLSLWLSVSLLLSTHKEERTYKDRERRQISAHQEDNPHRKLNPAGPWSIFQPRELWEDKFLLFLSHLVCGISLRQSKQINIHSNVIFIAESPLTLDSAFYRESTKA